MPFTSVVLPAPRSPRSSTIFGGAKVSARVRPKAIVSSAECVVISRAMLVESANQYSECDNAADAGLLVNPYKEYLDGETVVIPSLKSRKCAGLLPPGSLNPGPNPVPCAACD